MTEQNNLARTSQQHWHNVCLDGKHQLQIVTTKLVIMLQISNIKYFLMRWSEHQISGEKPRNKFCADFNGVEYVR